MILYQLKKNTNETVKEAFGKYYAFPVITQTIGINGLAAHMSSHNTGFSPGQVKGMLTDMVKCIKELVLSGVAVKIDVLAIFTLGIVNKEGASAKDDFTVQKNIESVKLRSRATGELMRAKLNLEANLKDIEKMTKTKEGGTDDGDNDNKPSGGGSTSGGNASGGGSTSGGGSSSGSDEDKGYTELD